MAEKGSKVRYRARSEQGAKSGTPKVQLLMHRLGVGTMSDEVKKIREDIKKLKSLSKKTRIKLLRSKIEYLENMAVSFDVHNFTEMSLDARQRTFVYNTREARLKGELEKIQEYEGKIRAIKAKIKKYQDYLVTKIGSIKLNLAVKTEIMNRLEKQIQSLSATYKKKKSGKKRGFFDMFYNRFKPKKKEDPGRRSQSVRKML